MRNRTVSITANKEIIHSTIETNTSTKEIARMLQADAIDSSCIKEFLPIPWTNHEQIDPPSSEHIWTQSLSTNTNITLHFLHIRHIQTHTDTHICTPCCFSGICGLIP